MNFTRKVGVFFTAGVTIAVFAMLYRKRSRALLLKKSPRGRRRRTKEEKKAMKELKRQEKKRRQLASSKKTLAELENRLRALQKSTSNDKRIRFVAIDVEAWEMDSKYVTEIGLASYEKNPSGGDFEHRHIIIMEHLALTNGRYVDDNRDHFLFGDSEILPLKSAIKEVSTELKSADYIVGHAVSGDIKWLKSIGVSFDTTEMGEDNIQNESENQMHKSITRKLIDTQVIALAYGNKMKNQRLAERRMIKALATKLRLGGKDDSKVLARFEYLKKKHAERDNKSSKQQSLKTLAKLHGVKTDKLHNGANDAAFTLQVLLSQCGIEFSPPSFTTSSHVTSEEFAALVDEAKQRALAEGILTAAQDENMTKVYVKEIEEFAALCNNKSVETSKTLEKTFPSTLTSRQRKCVHEAAATNGLSSCSRGIGMERYVSIRPSGASWEDGDVYISKEKMTKKWRKQRKNRKKKEKKEKGY